METKTIKINNTTIEVFSFLDRINLIKNKEEFLNKIIYDIDKINDEGFAGFRDKRGFKVYLKYEIFSDILKIRYPSEKISLKECVKLIEQILKKISLVLDKRKISIYIFPSLSGFIINKMNGNEGIWIWKNIIYINVFPKKDWGKYFKGTIAHEIAHLLSDYYSDNISMGEGLIFDGLAEHFQKKFIGIRSQWTKAISKKRSLEIFKEIKYSLNKKNWSLYNELFYGTGKYPLWAGYSVGYYLVEEYLKKQKNVHWDKLLRKNPKEILKELKRIF